MKLTQQQLRFLRGHAHKLKPVVMVGANGVTENLINELENALNTHELVKVKVRSEEREDRDEMIELLCRKTKSVKIQRVGHNLVLFRPNPDKNKFVLPKG